MEIQVCIGSSCHLKGSKDIVQILNRLITLHNVKDQVVLKGSFCMGDCVNGVCVKVDGVKYSLIPSDTENFFQEHILNNLK